MNNRLIAFVAMALLAGCTPEQFTRPTIPALPPAKPSDGHESRNRAPVTPAQVTPENARVKLSDLETELEDDARAPMPKR